MEKQKAYPEIQSIEESTKKVTLLISQIKKSVYDELESLPPEKEPFQEPLKNILREGFHKPIKPSSISPKRKQFTV